MGFQSTQRCMRPIDGVSPQVPGFKKLTQLLEPFRGSIRQGDGHFVKLLAPALEKTFRHTDDGDFMEVLLPFARVIVEKRNGSSAQAPFTVEGMGKLGAEGSSADDADSHRSRRWSNILNFETFAPPPQQQPEQ